MDKLEFMMLVKKHSLLFLNKVIGHPLIPIEFME